MAEYIDKNAFRQAMYHEAFETDTDMQKWDGGCWIRYKMFENMIENLPPTDAAPVVHGKWEYLEYIDDDNPYGIADVAKCSVCGFLGDESIAATYRYCPHCGARMDL